MVYLNQQILLPKYSYYILFFGNMFTITNVYIAYLQCLYTMVFIGLSITFTTALYWHNPRYGFRRTLDIYNVKLFLSYMIYTMYNNPHIYAFLCLNIAFVIFYISRRIYSMKFFTLYTCTHILFHFFSNLMVYFTFKDINNC